MSGKSEQSLSRCTSLSALRTGRLPLLSLWSVRGTRNQEGAAIVIPPCGSRVWLCLLARVAGLCDLGGRGMFYGWLA